MLNRSRSGSDDRRQVFGRCARPGREERRQTVNKPHYEKPPEMYDGLRLHQNENTGGCSPRVLEALASPRPDQIGYYPPYEATTRVVAAYLGVDPDWLSLVNGLDEGIMSAAVGYLR